MIRLIIADDHPIVREGLKRIITECSDMHLVSEAADGNEVLAQCCEHNVNVLLLDISMPGPGFLNTLQRLRVKHPDMHVLVLSIHPENHYAVRAIKAGAAGYLTKNHTPEELADAIRHVHKGRKYLTSIVAEELASQLQSGKEEQLRSVMSLQTIKVTRSPSGARTVRAVSFTQSWLPSWCTLRISH